MKQQALIIALACACVALPATAHAQGRGAYMGGGVGQTKMADWCSTSGGPPGLVLHACEDTDSGFKLFGGYQFNRYISVEGTYINWGKFSAAFGPNGHPSLTAKHQSFGPAALGSLPLGESFALLGKLGLLATIQKLDSRSEEGSETEVHYGVGARWHFARNGAVRAEWEGTSELKLQMISASVEFRF
jgi:OOP family OmpA-OmpF porin